MSTKKLPASLQTGQQAIIDPSTRPDARLFPVDVDLFDKFLQAIRSKPDGTNLTVAEFEKRLDDLNIEFYRLYPAIEFDTGALMTGVVICKETGKQQLIRDYFTSEVPTLYDKWFGSKPPRTQNNPPTARRGRPPKSKLPGTQNNPPTAKRGRPPKNKTE